MCYIRLVGNWLPGGGSNSEYVNIQLRKSFDDAKLFCEAEGGYLASISSTTEQSFVLSFLDK